MNKLANNYNPDGITPTLKQLAETNISKAPIYPIKITHASKVNIE